MSRLMKQMPYGWAAAGDKNKWYKPPRKKLCVIRECYKVVDRKKLCSKHKHLPQETVDKYRK